MDNLIRRVLFLQHSHVINRHKAHVESVLKGHRPDIAVSFASTPSELGADTTYDAIITPTFSLLDSALRASDGVKWIHFLSAGVDRIWSMDFDKSCYVMTKSNGVHAIPMSEHALGAMLYFAKRFDRYIQQSTERTWAKLPGAELYGSHLVVLGIGQVGKAIAHLGGALGMHVTGVSQSERSSDGSFEKIVPIERLGETLSTCDYLVVAVPLTARSKALINAERLAQFKPGGVVIDVSRGGVVDTEAIVAALDDGLLRGAALDVFETEPLRQDSPLWDRPDILLTPHVAGTTPNYMQRAMEIFMHNLNLFEAGESLHNTVDVTKQY